MPARKNPQPVPKTFEEALAELEAILSDIEAGEVPLEESLVKYERGQFLVQHCRAVLGQAEKQIELLSKAADGESIHSTPMPGSAAAAQPAEQPEDEDEDDGDDDHGHAQSQGK